METSFNKKTKSRNKAKPSEDKRENNYFVQLKPHYKTFEPKKLHLHQLV